MEINETEEGKNRENQYTGRAGSFKKSTKADKPLASLTKKKGEKAQIAKIRNEIWFMTIDLVEIERSTRIYCEQLRINKLDSITETY